MQGGPGGLRSPVGAGAAGVQHADPNRLLRRRLRPRVCQHPADERPDGVRAGGGARRGGARGAGAHQLVPQGDAVVRRLQLRRGRGAHQLLAVRHHGPARQLPQPHLEGADHLHAQRVGGARLLPPHHQAFGRREAAREGRHLQRAWRAQQVPRHRREGCRTTLQERGLLHRQVPVGQGLHRAHGSAVAVSEADRPSRRSRCVRVGPGPAGHRRRGSETSIGMDFLPCH
mmetsp:Transcript_56904/g.149908  ORF Transcript_56904/g.149908 Transcript_56904/m.149908 type:complete len:229 (+) Transcript_56904:306-992(+)